MYILEILISIFALFAISRSYLKLRKGSGSVLEFFIWTFIWTGIIVITFFPRITELPAEILGIGRGIDVFIYFAIVVLIYSTYRIYSKLEVLSQEITSITRELAIREVKTPKQKKAIKQSK